MRQIYLFEVNKKIYKYSHCVRSDMLISTEIDFFQLFQIKILIWTQY